MSKESVGNNTASNCASDTTCKISSVSVTVPTNIELTTTVGEKQSVDKHITSPSKLDEIFKSTTMYSIVILYKHQPIYLQQTQLLFVH